jgi:hypothetical protein
VDNRGIELSLLTTNVRNDVLEWNTSLGLSYNKNEIKHLYYEYEDVLDANGNVIGTKEVMILQMVGLSDNPSIRSGITALPEFGKKTNGKKLQDTARSRVIRSG